MRCIYAHKVSCNGILLYLYYSYIHNLQYSLCHKHITAFQWSKGLIVGICCLLSGTDQQHAMILN